MCAAKLKSISPSQSRSLWSQMSKLGYRLREPGALDLERAENFDNLFTYYKDELGFTPEQIATMMKIFIEEFESWGVEAMAPKVRQLRAVQ